MKLYYRIWREVRRDGKERWYGEYWRHFDWTWNPAWFLIQCAATVFGLHVGWHKMCGPSVGLGECSDIIGATMEEAEAYVRKCASHTINRLREERAAEIVVHGARLDMVIEVPRV